MNRVDYSMYILGNFDNGHLKPVRFLKQDQLTKKKERILIKGLISNK